MRNLLLVSFLDGLSCKVSALLQAVFNTQGQTRGLYCSKHKQEGMVGPGI